MGVLNWRYTIRSALELEPSSCSKDTLGRRVNVLWQRQPLDPLWEGEEAEQQVVGWRRGPNRLPQDEPHQRQWILCSSGCLYGPVSPSFQ